MIRVAICDDFPETVTQVNEYLVEYQQLRDVKLDIKSFYNAEELWEYLRRNPCDLIILDIELVEMNGVELGHLIRTELKDNIIKIVYISAKNCYDRQLFDVQPLNFLQKPIDKEKLFKMVDLTAELLSSRDRVFVFESKQGTFRMKFNDILYFESFDHYFKIETKSGDYEFKSTLAEIMEQISDSRFIQVHRSYIINYDNTSHIKYEEITILNGDVISISRDRRKEVRKIISELERVNI
jgi:DNA-binding LytR/AlgR family response regulator